MLDAFENLSSENDDWSYKLITWRTQTTWKVMLNKLYEVWRLKVHVIETRMFAKQSNIPKWYWVCKTSQLKLEIMQIWNYKELDMHGF